MFINLGKFEVEVCIFLQKERSKTGHKFDNFYDIKKLVCIALDNLITKKCANL